MNGLFNSSAYPAMKSPEGIAAMLSSAETRGAIFKDHVLKIPTEIFKVSDSAALAYEYSTSAPGRARKTAGRRQYAQVTANDVVREAMEAGITVQHNATDLVAQAINTMHSVFTDVYRSVWNDYETPVVSQLLFTPKGGIGRAPTIHIDNNRLTGHWAIALSSLDIMTSEPDGDTWNALNRKILDATTGVDKLLDADVLSYATLKQENFQASDIGDMLFLKGQRGRDLNDTFERRQMSVHKSPIAIREHGQVGAMFYPKFPKKTV